MAEIKNRRRQYLVNKKLQLQFTWLLIVQLIIPTFIFGIFIYVINRMYLTAMQRIVGAEVISDPYIQSILNFSVLAVGLFLVLSTILLMFLGIRFSHHIAGPIFKLNKILDQLIKGDKIESVCFRKTDMMEGLADKLNTIADKLCQLKK